MGNEEGTRSIFCCSSGFQQFVQTTAHSEEKPTVSSHLPREKHTMTECKQLCQQGLKAENGITMGYVGILAQTAFKI